MKEVDRQNAGGAEHNKAKDGSASTKMESEAKCDRLDEQKQARSTFALALLPEPVANTTGQSQPGSSASATYLSNRSHWRVSRLPRFSSVK